MGFIKINTPTKLTILRICMIPVFVVLYFVEFEGHKIAAAILYLVACFTDFLDGYIARKYKLVTNLGKFLDPIADKMIVACALIALCITEPVVNYGYVWTIVTAVFAMLILSRELVISGFRTIAADRGVVIAADMGGKLKTVFQMAAIFVLLPVTDYYAWHALTGEIFYYIGFALLAIATVLTVVSGVNYLIKNKHVLSEPEKLVPNEETAEKQEAE